MDTHTRALAIRRKAMMDEDAPTDLVTQHSKPPPTPPSSGSRRASASSTKSPRVLVTLAGRVYRPPTEDEKQVLTKAEIEANLLLTEPIETVDDLERSRRQDKRKLVELEMKRQRIADANANLSPSKGKGRLLAFDSDDDDDDELAVKVARTPTKQSPTKRRPTTPPPSLGLPFGFPSASTSATALSPSHAQSSLPPSLDHLLSLHTALERALILHLSTHGSAVASTVSAVHPTSSNACVRMTNLIDLPTLTRMLAASGKRFTAAELAKLCWVWQGAGEDDDDDDDDEGDLTIRGSERQAVQGDEAGGMGFLITRARLSKLGKVSSTYGVGISVAVKANPQLPKFQLLPPASPKRSAAAATTTMPPSPSSIGKGRDGMSIVALWTQGKEDRRKEFKRRLLRWARLGGHQVVEAEMLTATDPSGEDDDVRWATSAASHLLRHVPSADLPALDFAVPAIPSTLTPSPTKKPSPSSSEFYPSSPTTPRSTNRNDLPVASPQDFVRALMDGRPVKTKSGTTLDRDKARRERIEAKQRAAQPTAYQASLSGLATGGLSPSKRSLKPKPTKDDVVLLTVQEIYKRRAMLSRLGTIADVVAMRCGSRPTRFDDVCTAVSNSPNVSIGFDEADQALEHLAEKFPQFCYIKHVGRGSLSSLSSTTIGSSSSSSSNAMTTTGARGGGGRGGGGGGGGQLSSSSPSSLLSTRGERWIVLTGNQKPKEVKELVRHELNQTASASASASAAA